MEDKLKRSIMASKHLEGMKKVFRFNLRDASLESLLWPPLIMGYNWSFMVLHCSYTTP